MFRSRDIAAAFVALVLARMAWHADVLDALGASVHLSWYLPTQFASPTGGAPASIALPPTLLDVDGDGAAEALVVVRDDRRLQVFDLRRAARRQWKAPFAPPSLLESVPVPVPPDAHALRLTTGHVRMAEDTVAAEMAEKAVVKDDATRHYYCGSDWHDAAKCGVHCPNGLSSDCPPGETCFADTPCDAVKSLEEAQGERSELAAMYTPQGSLPAVATLWDNGALTLHALLVSNTTHAIELSLLWQVNLLANYTVLNWESQHLEFLDAATADNGHGLVILTGSVDLEHQLGADPLRVLFVAAINAKTGAVQWESLSENEALNPEPERPLPLLDAAMSSVARRRSLKPKAHTSSRLQLDDNCLHFYRRSVLLSGVLPHLYWDHASVRSQAVHFEAAQQRERLFYHARHRRNDGGRGAWWTGGRRHRGGGVAGHPHRGRPNVVATSDETGLQLRSLRNGRRLCHLTLWQETLYTDLNFDGTLDSVSLVTGRRRLRDDDEQGEERRWISELVAKVAKLQGNTAAMEEVEKEIDKQAVVEANLCHLNALSGVPAKEELYSINVCGSTYPIDVDTAASVTPAPPLAVEAIRGRGKDIVAAVGTGCVTRVQGATGRRIWQVCGKHSDFPKWEDDSIVTLTQIDSGALIAENRPVLLIGENSLAVLSARHGRQLVLTPFPQLSHALDVKPIVDDFNGDGTNDVIIETDEALWGYTIHIQTGVSTLYRISVGLLLMLVMLALLKNRFGSQPGRRSTDA